MFPLDRGVNVTFFDGMQRSIFPLLFSVVGDYPETCMATCTYSGANVNWPCSMCWCPQHHLDRPATDLRASPLALDYIAWRDEPTMVDRVAGLLELEQTLSKTAWRLELKRLSLHAVVVSACAFCRLEESINSN